MSKEIPLYLNIFLTFLSYFIPRKFIMSLNEIWLMGVKECGKAIVRRKDYKRTGFRKTVYGY